MSLSIHSVLVAVVDHAEESDETVTEQAIAESLDVSQSELTEPLETLCEFDMVSRTENGYRPTITAHELLDAGIELDEPVVLDLVAE